MSKRDARPVRPSDGLDPYRPFMNQSERVVRVHACTTGTVVGKSKARKDVDQQQIRVKT